MDGDRPVAPRDAVVEHRRPVTVVEDDEGDRGRGAREPPMERSGVRRDLGRLSRLERDSETGEVVAVGVGSGPADPRESLAVHADERAHWRPSAAPHTRATGRAS